MTVALIVGIWLACSWLSVHLLLRWWQHGCVPLDIDSSVVFMALATAVLGPLALIVAAGLYLQDWADGRNPSRLLLRLFGIRDGGAK